VAVALHTNAGFVSASPVDDPAASRSGTVYSCDNRAVVVRDTAPVGATTITELGWWCDTASEAANFELGLYDSDGAVAPGEAGTLLYKSEATAKGTAAGWKKITGLNISITAEHVYWLALQLDNTATTTMIDGESSGGSGVDANTSATTTLLDPFGGGAISDTDGMYCVYAVWASGAQTYLASGAVNESGVASRLLALNRSESGAF